MCFVHRLSGYNTITKAYSVLKQLTCSQLNLLLSTKNRQKDEEKEIKQARTNSSEDKVWLR